MDDLSHVIEEELPVNETPDAEVAPLSLREALVKARDEAKSKDETDEKPVVEAKTITKAQKDRDEAGKFVKSEEKTAPKVKAKPDMALSQPVTPPVDVTHEVQAPEGLSPQIKAMFATLPKEVQAEFSRREQNFHKKLTEHDEERNFGRTVDKIVAPYMPQIRAEGATAPQAIESLLNMAHVLRVGNPQQKAELILRTAQTYGVDLRQALSQVQTQPNPLLQQTLQEVQSLKQQIEQEKTQKKQREDEDIQQQIKAFSADPKNLHFETVKAHMAALLQGGLAKDLPDAYEQAVHANPQTRSTLLEQNDSAKNEKRLADQKARAEAARKAGSSLKGGPGIVAAKNGRIIQQDLRSELQANFAAFRDS